MLEFHKNAADIQAQRNWNIQLGSEGMPAELEFEHEQFLEVESDAMDKAGVDDNTDSSTLMDMNGRNIWIVDDVIE